ncbi:signal peptidase II [Vagococcus penaei]|uniref:Lipoprotein signal peptidase n=1 Tax=Vagococcus penaei TaxID=633807 RepID=A0A1Q2D404_9ENTE|nr:signal peptidase II [Vagococcus penaei]AQP53126.1 signal peptidase II [Vagococcus penaei]RSU06012.1 signal peptidase II [Vagococcus penaei]
MLVYVLVILGTILVDQIVKWWTVANIPLFETIGHNPVMSLTYIQNRGGAWSILEGRMWVLVLITLVALIIFPTLLYKNRHSSKWLTIGLSLIIGGTLGNFIDRLRIGYVVDMFQVEFINFPIFNVADIALNIGVICMFVYILFIEGKEDKQIK